ncbi:hypothetical protein MC885_011866 [Smutsia gigantea]|nr:hypothetical protein MC885_011866 [Smutsia gigantea]
MHPWVAISSLILLLMDAVVSDVQVSGVVGQPVTLPCTYSTANGVTTMCWGRGTCPRNLCSDELVWTDGTHITFQKHTRYKLEGDLLEGNVSLTIENAALADSGQYCCRVEHRGWFNDMKRTLSLEIKPAEVTRVPTSPRVFTSASPMPAPTQSLQPVATSSAPVQTAETHPTTLQGTRSMQPTNSPLYSCPTEYLCMRNKLEQLNMVSLNDSHIGALQSSAEVRVRAEDNIYIIEDNLYVME